MRRLSIIIDGSPSGEAELRSGVNRIGRSPENDVPIAHPSISGQHCEIHVNETSIFVRDLGSTNGTFIDGQPIYESELLPGQSLTAFNSRFRVNPSLQQIPWQLRLQRVLD